MTATHIYTKYVNGLIIVFDRYGNKGTSRKSPQVAYQNYLRNRKRNNKVKFAEDVLKAERKAKKANKEIQPIKASYLF